MTERNFYEWESDDELPTEGEVLVCYQCKDRYAGDPLGFENDFCEECWTDKQNDAWLALVATFPQIGDRVIFTEVYDRYPHVWVNPKQRGTVVGFDADQFTVRLDDYDEKLDEWDNEVIFYLDQNEERTVVTKYLRRFEDGGSEWTPCPKCGRTECQTGIYSETFVGEPDKTVRAPVLVKDGECEWCRREVPLEGDYIVRGIPGARDECTVEQVGLGHLFTCDFEETAYDDIGLRREEDDDSLSKVFVASGSWEKGRANETFIERTDECRWDGEGCCPDCDPDQGGDEPDLSALGKQLTEEFNGTTITDAPPQRLVVAEDIEPLLCMTFPGDVEVLNEETVIGMLGDLPKGTYNIESRKVSDPGGPHGFRRLITMHAEPKPKPTTFKVTATVKVPDERALVDAYKMMLLAPDGGFGYSPEYVASLTITPEIALVGLMDHESCAEGGEWEFTKNETAERQS
jgi:hypothetical protein